MVVVLDTQFVPCCGRYGPMKFGITARGGRSVLVGGHRIKIAVEGRHDGRSHRRNCGCRTCLFLCIRCMRLLMPLRHLEDTELVTQLIDLGKDRLCTTKPTVQQSVFMGKGSC